MPAPFDIRAVLLAFAVANTAALSAAPPWPTAQEIERTGVANPFPTLDRLQGIPKSPLPQLAPSGPGLDVEAIARRHLELNIGIDRSVRTESTLKVFVTLAMPDGSLRRLVDQAERSGAVLVLRGLKAQSMSQTLAAVQTLIESRQVAWQIDPEAFTRYDVAHTPTFVLSHSASRAQADQGNCVSHCGSHRYVKVAGDVSLDYALANIVVRHPEAASAAAPFLAKLRSSR